MSVKHSFRITKGGWALLGVCALLTLGAFNASLNMIYLLSSLLIGIFLIALVAPLWSTRRIECSRTLPELPIAGRPFNIDLHARSLRRTGVRFLVLRDPLCRGLRGRLRNNLLLRLGAGERATLTCRADPLPRGVHRLAGVALASGFPFGVAESRVRNADFEELLVYPGRGTLSMEMSLALKSQGTRIGAQSRYGIPSEEFRAVREYKPGDNPRRIHWRATAHHDKLHVREMERERFAPMLVILDSRIPDSLPPPERARAEEGLELAVSFVADMCRYAQREGSAIAVLAFFPEPRLLRVGNDGDVDAVTGSALPADPPPTVATSPGARLPYGPNHILTALARLTPAADERAGALTDILNSAEIAQMRRVVAVTPSRRTALGLRPVIEQLAAQMLIATEPGFSNVYRLDKPAGEDAA